ncbi:unnamed protein product, partial [Staurois parvus]
QRGDQWCAVSLCHSRSPISGKSRRRLLDHVISCVQSQLIADHQGIDDQCALMISVAPAVPPVSVQCQLSVLISATCQCLPMHINATYQCPSELLFSAAYQSQSVPPISAIYEC